MRHLRAKLLELITETLFDFGSDEHTRLFAHDLGAELTRNQTSEQLFDFAEFVLPPGDLLRLRAFANNNYPLLLLSVDSIRKAGDSKCQA